MTHPEAPITAPAADGALPAAVPVTVAVVGASGRVGQRVSQRLREAGHRVVPVSRTPDPGAPPPHRPVDALDPEAVRAALEGVDAVVVALGIAENPLRVRLRGSRGTADDVRSRGTRHVIEAMRATGARRLVVLSSTGVGDSAGVLTPGMRLVIAGLLHPQFADHARQEELVRSSCLDWTIARPVNLCPAASAPVVADPHGRVVSMDVGIDQVADCLARWATSSEHLGATVALSS